MGKKTAVGQGHQLDGSGRAVAAAIPAIYSFLYYQAILCIETDFAYLYLSLFIKCRAFYGAGRANRGTGVTVVVAESVIV
jgi:hypothetical protein